MKLSRDEVNALVSSVYQLFDKLPKRGKPQTSQEWTTLAAFIVRYNGSNTIASLATGTRCLGEKLLDPTGGRLHDSHAEILARRGFQRFLMTKIVETYNNYNGSSLFEFNKETGKLKLKEEVDIIFVTTQTPCGDASIFPRPEGDIHPQRKRKLEADCSVEPVVKKQSNAINEENAKNFSDNGLEEGRVTLSDPQPGDDIYRTGAKCVLGAAQDSYSQGVAYHVTAQLRIKPGRGDRTQSLSCSDKMARWNILGCQGCLTMIFLDKPVYIDSIIVAGCPYDERAIVRALYERLKNIKLSDETFHINQANFYYSSLPFKHGKQVVESTDTNAKVIACSSSLLFIEQPHHGETTEVSVDGYKQGVTKNALGKPQSRLSICRKDMFNELLCALNGLPAELANKLVNERHKLKTYSDFKSQTGYYKSWLNLKENSEFFKLWPTKNISFSQFEA